MECELNFESAIGGLSPEINADGSPELDVSLPNQTGRESSAKASSGRRKYDPLLWGKSARASKDLAREMEADLKRRISVNPAKYAGLSMKLSVSARPKSTPGSHLVTKDLIKHILTATGAKQTQTECRDAIQARYPDHAIAKDWTKPLAKWVTDFTKKLVASTAAPFNKLVVRPGMSLRDLHAAARQMECAASGTVATYKATIAITEDAIVINGVEFKISDAKTGKYKYRSMRASIPTLLTALSKR